MNPNLKKTAAPLATCTAGPVRVTYRDTDRMGHAYHSQYFVWFEIGRTELLRTLGSTYREWEDSEGVFLPVRECQARYLKPAGYDDLVVIDTQMVRITRASVAFEYQVRRKDDLDLLAMGVTTHAFVDQNGKIVRAADQLLPQFFGR